MNCLKFKSICLTVVLLAALFFTQTTYAQDQITKFLTESTNDGSKIIEAWAKPFLTASGVNLNNGWYVSADPLKLGRFEFRLVTTASIIPAKDRTFNVEDLELSTIRVKQGEPVEAPTIFGKTGDAIDLEAITENPLVPGQIEVLKKFKSPTAIGTPIFPSLMPQISVGLVKGTEVMIRWVPAIKLNNFKKTSFGVGIKHDILQWIPSAEKFPLSMSIIGAYSKSNLLIEGEELLKPIEGVPNPNPPDYASQSIEYDNSAWNIGLIASKKLPVLTLFGGLQLSNSETSLSLKGPYPVKVLNSLANEEIANLTDPIKIESKHNQFGINGGLRVKMGIMHITVAGTYAPGGYSSVFLAWGIGYFN